VDSLYLSGRDLFWPDLYKGVIRHLSLATGISEDFATNQVYASSITGDGQNLYWVTRPATGSVFVRSPISNGVPSEVGPARSSGGLTTDGKYLYWYDRFGGTVNALRTTGVLPMVVARSGMPSGLAIDDQAIYWTDDDGAIRKVAKP
jgi:sugar lactone lactonase YvrE